MAVIANSALMTVPFALYRFTKRSYGQRAANLSFVVYWISLEFIHLNWDLAWPWLNLGNAFAENVWMVQWYEYTGALGGSVWLLIINLWVFDILRKEKVVKIKFVLPAFFILVPLLISWSIDIPMGDKDQEEEVLILQPNIDPYNAKFRGTKSFIPYDDQVRIMALQAERNITPSTKYVLAPETAVQGRHEMQKIPKDYMLSIFRVVIKKHPQINLLTGIELMEWYIDRPAPENAKTSRDGFKYQTYNAAVYMNAEKDSVYKKSKFVPGVEQLPYPSVFGVILDIIDFDQYGAYGPQEERTAFYTLDSIAFAPIICYESVFGDYIAHHVRNGANYLFIITNDGWWMDTDGHRQHNLYAKLRAIETRRWIARSANTGLSSVIDPSGKIIAQTEWWERTVLKEKVRPLTGLTFYVRYGDIIGRISAFMAIGFMISAYVRKKVKS